MSHVVAIVVAAGRGLRTGAEVPKQYRMISGRTLLAHSLAGLLGHPGVGGVQAVIHPADEGRYREAVAPFGSSRRLLPPVPGGATRQASVRAGLEAVAAKGSVDLVLVHDAARPFVSAALIDRAIAAARSHGAAVPGIPVTDTIKLVDDAAMVAATPERARLRAIQTPQAFRFAALLAAHRKAAAEGRDGFTDDGALAEWAKIPVHVFPGDAGNMKVTEPADFAEAERRFGNATSPVAAAPLVVRVGTGYDVHAFTAGDHVFLGGIRVPHDRGVLAHSDGDVVLHALTDALLGALAEGDIGMHFPPSEARWRNAGSDRFLAFAAERVKARGGVIDHLDVTIVCEAPRVGPHREAMRQRIAAIAGISRPQVAVKATTSERMGFAGRREGLAAHAAATVRLPAGDGHG